MTFRAELWGVTVCTWVSTWKWLSWWLAANGANSINDANNGNSADRSNGVNEWGTVFLLRHITVISVQAAIGTHTCTHMHAWPSSDWLRAVSQTGSPQQTIEKLRIWSKYLKGQDGVSHSSFL